MHYSTILIATCAPFLAAGASLPPSLKRDIPQECQFPLGRENDFGYWDATQDAQSGTACVGFGLGTPACGPWSVQEQADAISAVSDQLKQDGQFKSTRFGRWIATFNLLTTAFDDRNPIYFDHYFQNAQCPDCKASDGAGALSYYYLRNGNMLTVEADGCP